MTEGANPGRGPDVMGHASPTLGVIEQRLGYLMHRTNLLHMGALHQLLRPIDMTPARATALVWIHNNPGTGQSDLARALGINRASAMELAAHLESIGAVERSPGRGRRSTALTLTARGLQMHEAFIAATIKADALLAGDLSPQERVTLAELLCRVRATLNRHLEQPVPKDNQEGKMS